MSSHALAHKKSLRKTINRLLSMIDTLERTGLIDRATAKQAVSKLKFSTSLAGYMILQIFDSDIEGRWEIGHKILEETYDLYWDIMRKRSRKRRKQARKNKRI